MNAVLTQANLITRQGDLRNLAQEFANQPVLGVDTESNSLYAYQERVCLVQFSTLQGDYLVDPLTVRDFSPLEGIFASPEIVKVFHAAEYDLICLRRDFGIQVSNLFDTMLAMRILGRTTLGLGAILEAEFGVKVDKKHQRANWGQRPLPQDLLDYARMDTHFLIPLRERLLEDLQTSGLWELAAEDFERFSKMAFEEPGNEENPRRGIKGERDLRPQQYAVLLQLKAYRERAARQVDRPLFKVIGDKTLLAVAETCPKSLDELRSVEGMTRGQIDRHGRGLLEAVRHGLAAKPVRLQRSVRPDEQFMLRLEKLRQWRKATAQTMGIESDVVLPKDLMTALAEKNPQTEAELKIILQDTPWRMRKYGKEILKVLRV
jgi:ribonuclease D